MKIKITPQNTQPTINWQAECTKLLKRFMPASWSSELLNIELRALAEIQAKQAAAKQQRIANTRSTGKKVSKHAIRLSTDHRLSKPANRNANKSKKHAAPTSKHKHSIRQTKRAA